LCTGSIVVVSYGNKSVVILGFLNSFQARNIITAVTTPAIPAVTIRLEADPNIHFQKVPNNMAPMTRAAR